MQLLSLLAVAVTVSASTLTPPVLPLIVRNPYLSTWLGDARDAPWEHWPMFWTGSSVSLCATVLVPPSIADMTPHYRLASRSWPLSQTPIPFTPFSGDPKTPCHHLPTFPTYLGAAFDASTTNLSYAIPPPKGSSAPVKVVLSFLSPITPTSTFRQSIPAAYMTVYAEGSFDINIYTDLNGEWVSGNRDNKIVWDLSKPKASEKQSAVLKTWQVSRQTEQLLTEFADHAEWGTLHFTGPADVYHQAGTSGILRHHFATKGTLKNEVDTSYRKIMDEEPVFAFAKSFHLSNKTGAGFSSADSVLFTFALVQDPVVQFAAARGLTQMRPLWSFYFATSPELIQYHYDDFAAASLLARNYSSQLAIDAFASGSQDYQDIAALSARQVLGATQFSGTPDDPILFLKEISSNGNFQTVDVIFPAFPFFLYTNPRWLAYLLEPLLEHQLSGQYPNDYSMHDLGAHFPNATGHPDGKDEYMPVEECGNMLIMGLALVNAFKYDTQPAFLQSVDGYARSLEPVEPKTTNNPRPFGLSPDAYGMDQSSAVSVMRGSKEAEKWVARSYELWTKWTGYLVRESLIPANQLCTDDFAGWLANQTNLALKGIIGIKAMAEIADVLGKADDSKYYADVASEYIDKWQGFGISRDGSHAKLAYTWYGSWTTIYNLYADSLLCFHLPEKANSYGGRVSGWLQKMLGLDTKTTFIPDKVYSMQSNWYHAVLQHYGLPLDSRHLYTKSDWQFFAAAVTSKKTRTEVLQSIATWVNETTTDRPLTDLYETEGTGGWPGPHFMARPVVGGHFAFLALERACGGKALDGLSFLDEPGSFIDVDVRRALEVEAFEGTEGGQLVVTEDL
ncbi:glutaminase a [Colletotrichum karsti]|uniref:Glutaminase a n=1 Tax=Colletotrichum karsti TaxID=1095194 RepID=A0A9P6LD50_9PEZI|nr:glutaminase a [Colletotrichum karsti]KAF9870839.1 glutaminase a [Colletotrichum karsti]